MQLFRPPKGTLPYAPSATVTIGAGATETLEFVGLDGEAFGFTRILVDAGNLNQIRATIKNNKGRDTLATGVHLAAIRQLFLNRALHAPFVIENQNRLDVQLTNDTVGALTARVQLVGYTEEMLEAWRSWSQETHGRILQPIFVHASEQLAAGASKKQVAVDIGTARAEVSRMAMGSEALSDISLSVQAVNQRMRKVTIDDDVTAAMLNDRYLDRAAESPILVDPSHSLTLFFTNASGVATRRVSMIGEAYLAA